MPANKKYKVEWLCHNIEPRSISSAVVQLDDLGKTVLIVIDEGGKQGTLGSRVSIVSIRIMNRVKTKDIWYAPELEGMIRVVKRRPKGELIQIAFDLIRDARERGKI